MPAVELTKHEVGVFGLVVALAVFIWIVVAILGFISRDRNRKAQGGGDY